METSRTNITQPISALKLLFEHFGYTGYEIKYMDDLSTAASNRKKKIRISDMSDKYFIEVEGDDLLPKLDNHTLSLGGYTFYGLTISDRRSIKLNLFTFLLKCEIEEIKICK